MFWPGNGADEERRGRGPQNVPTSGHRENHEGPQDAPAQRPHPGGVSVVRVSIFSLKLGSSVLLGRKNSVAVANRLVGKIINR